MDSRSRILLVEDNVYVAKYIRKRLIIEGFEVIEARSGAEALQSIRSGVLPDLIITDLAMPKMNGLQLMNAVRSIEEAKSIPVLVLSGTATVEQRVECLDHGASDYLCKPIDGSELAARVRVHLRNTEELRRLRREARFDPLTGVLNRRGAIEALQRECDRARRSGGALTILLIDADKFKGVNDTYGHAAGDQVLVELAGALKECLRITDIVGRIGGDEFIIALPNVQQPLAASIKKRLRKRVAANIVPGSESQTVSISIGLVVDDEGQIGLEQLFDMADKAMYLDKGRGQRKLKAVSEQAVAAQEFQL
ncbi:MAG: diguanylate cyclase [Kofleriaceae bacterium]|nr:diguanylate cyclase [Kofleriaceae bacterium]